MMPSQKKQQMAQIYNWLEVDGKQVGESVQWAWLHAQMDKQTKNIIPPAANNMGGKKGI